MLPVTGSSCLAHSGMDVSKASMNFVIIQDLVTSSYLLNKWYMLPVTGSSCLAHSGMEVNKASMNFVTNVTLATDIAATMPTM